MLARKLRKSTTSQSNPSSSKTPLFGQQLSKVCPENEKLPKPIMEMLTLLLKKGTFTEGVFRKAGNARNLREVRDDLNNGKDVDMGSKPVLLLAALLKDFLRQLPGSLLVADQYKDWTSALERKDIQERYAELKQVLDKLPRVNVVLLQHLLCLLHHISQNVSTNKMDAKNLAICFAPTLLHCDPLKDEKGKLDKVTNLTLFLIENCCEIFGEQVQTLLGEPDEEELVDNSDSLSSHQHDSAYDSTDPDADGEMGGPSGVMEDNPRSCCCKNQTPPIPSCSSSAIFNAFTRRRSEPTIFPSARSCDDFALSRLRFQEQPLKKQVSDDSVLMSGRGERTGALPPLTGNWTTTTTASAVDLKGGSCSSSCSLESSFSNQSESSVFTSSPLASPSGCRRSLMPHHPSFSTSKSGEEPPTPAPTPLPSQQLDKEVKEVKRRAQSMRNDGRNLHQRRARSWSNVLSRGGSLKKGDPQKEGAPFPCETLREDSLSEAEPVNPLIPRRRPLSAVEVFQQVDSRIPSRPPSYELALLSGAQPAPPQYPLTVRDARELERKSRPSSVSEESLLYTCPNQALMDCHFQHMPATVPSGLAMPIPDSAPLAFRQRAMSESVSRVQQEKLTRRCSQPLFEEISYAKESYV
ncbi:hypothetical protein JZ751_010333 [Albula glossodonta]|uniref:Rho-GAP domain-containing protein n=1 Tax=Albula glossodonta TaxID=121402 RepID=A0A8T2P4Z6_9TELE|nr:hypothetical protein JZ751_010333 [Albula glossodonta]